MGSLRVEKKLLVYGVDMDETISPVEAGLGCTIKRKAADYIGKNVVESQKANGVRRKLVALDSARDRPVTVGSPVFLNAEEVGKVTSTAVAFALGRRASIALISAEAAVNGSGVTVRSGDDEIEATVSLRPLYDPANLRAGG